MEHQSEYRPGASLRESSAPLAGSDDAETGDVRGPNPLQPQVVRILPRKFRRASIVAAPALTCIRESANEYSFRDDLDTPRRRTPERQHSKSKRCGRAVSLDELESRVDRDAPGIS